MKPREEIRASNEKLLKAFQQFLRGFDLSVPYPFSIAGVDIRKAHNSGFSLYGV